MTGAPERSEATGLLLVGAVLASVLASYVAFYVFLPADGTTRLVALVGMFVFLLVVTALALLFDRWWRG